MKHLKLFLATVVASICFFNYAQAQQKFGYINVTELISAMPDTKVADQSIQDLATMLENQMRVMTNEYQTKVADYQARVNSMTPAMQEDKVKEIQDLERRITDFQQKAQQDITKKQEDVFAPILQKAEDAIKAVAKEHHIAYVFDISKGVLIEYPESDDILPLVKKKLGI
jgi:outer membrane protein